MSTTAPDLADELGALLNELDAAVEELRLLTDEQRQILARPDATAADRLAALHQRHDHALTRIHRIERTRSELARTARLPSARVSDLARELPEHAQQPLLQRANSARRRLQAVQQQAAALSQASAALLRHMQSLRRQIDARASGAGLYANAPANTSAHAGVTASAATIDLSS